MHAAAHIAQATQETEMRGQRNVALVNCRGADSAGHFMHKRRNAWVKNTFSKVPKHMHAWHMEGCTNAWRLAECILCLWLTRINCIHIYNCISVFPLVHTHALALLLMRTFSLYVPLLRSIRLAFLHAHRNGGKIGITRLGNGNHYHKIRCV